MARRYKFILAFVLSVLVAACGTDTSSGDHNSGNGARSDVSISTSTGGGEPSGGEFSLRITDAPIDDLVQVVMTFTAVEMKHKNGPWVLYTFNTPQQIDILQYSGTASADLLANVPIEPGTYKRIRLFVSADPADNFVELRSGGIVPLDVPKGSTKGLQLSGTFDIPSDRPTNFTIDIDLRQSVISPKAGDYEMDLKYRVVRNDLAGHVRGTIDPMLLVDPSCSDADVDSFNTMYVYKGHNVTPLDINQKKGKNKGPVTTTPIRYDAASGEYLFEAAYLKKGKYTVAFTCNADQETLDADDNLQFFNIQNIKVLVNDIVFLK